jgi:nucleoside-diphosphate-sugar epimerase
MKIFVTGGLGYKGHVLIPKLLAKGHEVVVFDLGWFGNYLTPSERLKIIIGDVRDLHESLLDSIDVIIHLSSIANDPCGDLNPKLTWEVSALATMQLADLARRKNIKRFIYASSGSVYGVKSEDDVTEELTLNPLSEYNKTKMVSERVLLSYMSDMAVQIVRPATVCGISPRMRLDVSVNMLTTQALVNGKITVFGGDQTRPNIHIDDVTDLYLFLLDNPQFTGIYNAGFENLTIFEIADKIRKKIPCEIHVSKSNDIRSYRINSDKILKTGFTPKKNVDNAIEEIISAYSCGSLTINPQCYNLDWMEKNGLAI